MRFQFPQPFVDALAKLRASSILPTRLTSDQLMAIGPAIRERALFSARVANAEFLQELATLLDAIVGGVSPGPGMSVDQPLARLTLKEYLDRTNYAPADPKDVGTIKDLRTDKRLDLILETNVKMARGYGQWIQGQDADVLDEFPAQELVRIESRKEPRDWMQRWRGAGGRLSGGGRMIALKTDPIWREISAFGLPYPPFDFNSGMGVVDIDRDEAEAIGILAPDEAVEPDVSTINENLQMSPAVRDSELRRALMDDLDEVAFDSDGVLIWKAA